jgi:hypothetical protein
MADEATAARPRRPDRLARVAAKLRDPVRALNDRQIARRRAVVVSYPKSGRTWLRKILQDLKVTAPFTHAGSDALAQGRPIADPDPDAFRDHSVVFILRDPRDVAVSYHDDLTKRYRAVSESLSETLRHPGAGIEAIAAFNMAWMRAARSFRRFHRVRYEEMLDDSVAQVLGVTRFLSLPWISESRIAAVCAASSFERMRKAEQDGDLATRYSSARFTDGSADSPFRKVRRGRAGGFREDMSPEDVAFSAATLQRLNYPRAWLAEDLD